MSEPLELVIEDDLVIVFDKGRALLRLSHRGKYDGRSGLSFPPEQADDARRLVDALVAGGATRV